MIRLLVAVATIAAAAIVTARAGLVNDPTDPSGLAPIQTLTPPPRFKFKKAERPVEVGAPSDDAESVSEMLEEQNLMMRVYLNYFDDQRKKRVDQYSKDNMEVIKLLMAHGWLYLMKPTMNDLKDIIPIDERRTVEDLRNDLVLEIKERNKRTPVADALLWYALGIQKQMKKDAEKDINTYNKMIVSKKITLRITDPIIKERIAKENKGNNEKLENSRIYREFNQVTFKMCLMSYIIIFRGLPFSERSFTIVSSDGRLRKTFVTPPLQRNAFEQLLVEAEMELEEEDSENPTTGTDSYTLKEFRAEKNLLIKSYLIEFEQMRKKSTSYDEKDALNIIKLLILQSWLYLLKPDISMLKDIRDNIEPHKNADDVRNDIILELKKTMPKNDIEDAINLYAKSLSQKVKDTLEKQAETLVIRIDNNLEQIERLSPGLFRDRKIIEKNENLLKLEEMRLNVQFHDMTQKMCLQSFVLNYFKSPYPATITLLPSHDSPKEFDVPPLGADSFEQISYDVLTDSSEEDDI